MIWLPTFIRQEGLGFFVGQLRKARVMRRIDIAWENNETLRQLWHVTIALAAGSKEARSDDSTYKTLWVVIVQSLAIVFAAVSRLSTLLSDIHCC
jgi:hypothetical protein